MNKSKTKKTNKTTQLQKDYELVSGNYVKNGIIYDSNGHEVCPYSDELAKMYLENSYSRIIKKLDGQSIITTHYA